MIKKKTTIPGLLKELKNDRQPTNNTQYTNF